MKFKRCKNDERRLSRLVEQTSRREGILNKMNQTSSSSSSLLHQPFQLNTQIRAIKRREFESYLKTKSMLADAMKRMRESERITKENKAIRSQRTQTIFHAHLIKHFKPLVIKPSDKPLTIPVPFHFHI